MYLPHSPSSAGREELVSRWLAGMGTVWTSRNGQRTIQSEECKCGIFDFGLLSVSHFCKSKHRLLCGQKIYKLRQTKLSQFVEFSLILRKREETNRTHISLLTESVSKCNSYPAMSPQLLWLILRSKLNWEFGSKFGCKMRCAIFKRTKHWFLLFF